MPPNTALQPHSVDAYQTGMTFGRRVDFVTTVVGALLIVIGCIFIAWQWSLYARAKQTLDTFQTFRATLIAMEKISAERGPTNGALGAELPIPPAQIAALNAARASSDFALEQLLAQLHQRHCRACAAQVAETVKIQTQLAHARADVDQMLDLPRAQRTAAMLDRTIGAMADIIPRFDPLAHASGTSIIDNNPSASVSLQTAQLAADLREQAGLLGSRFTGALGARRPLTEAEQWRIEGTRGRVDQLRALIATQAGSLPPEQQATVGQMEKQYVGAGLAYVTEVREVATLDGANAPSPREFATRYVPLMHPIIELRDASLVLAQHELEARRNTLLTQLVGLFCAVLAGLVLLFFAAEQIRRQIIRPLTEATRAIMRIGSGDFSELAPRGAYRGEMHALFGAVQTLRKNNLDRRQSINYASLIQRAILPDRRLNALLGDRFAALWRPRDTVGGDFYLCRETDDGFVIGVIDCAGHGVPGALMTMLAHATFDQAIDETRPDPAAILQKADLISRSMLGEDRFDTALASTMDAGIVHFSRRTNRLTFSGARVSLFASDGNEVRKHNGGRRALADRRPGRFENVDVPLLPGWTYYLSTDGFLDQSGGTEGFGFGTGRFTQMLQDHARQPLAEQIRAFAAKLDAWRGQRAQRDDVTLLAFRPGEEHAP
jgi:serine phosphatase RsbU (regulator of sigma subunit)